MRDALKSYLALATGVTDLTRQAALAAAKALVSQGEATAEQVTGLAEDLLAQTRQNREAVVALVSHEVDRALARVGLASADEVVALVQRVRELESQLQSTAATFGAASSPRTASTASPAKGRAAARGPADEVDAAEGAARGPEDRAPARRTAAKQAATAKAVRRRQPATSQEQLSASDAAEVPAAPAQDGAPASPAAPGPQHERRAESTPPTSAARLGAEVPAQDEARAEAPADQASGSKSPAKKAPAKKARAEKAPAKKARAKKAPAEKAPAEKARAKKAPAKKTAAKGTATREVPAKGAATAPGVPARAAQPDPASESSSSGGRDDTAAAGAVSAAAAPEPGESPA